MSHENCHMPKIQNATKDGKSQIQI